MAKRPAVTKSKSSRPRAQQLYGTAARLAQTMTRQPDPDLSALHDKSVKAFPKLALSAEEYVIEDIKRHPIGIISIWLVAGLFLALIFGLLAAYSLNYDSIVSNITSSLSSTLSGAQPAHVSLPTAASIFPIALFLAAFVILGGIIATIVYEGNEFFLTNEAIFQNVQTSLFNTQTQVVNLINVEDASQDQTGILQQVLNYGTLRVSTQGEETTYHFYFVANPSRVVAMINTASEKAVLKMQGVPVTEH